MKNIRHKKKRVITKEGFTIVEALVAISILVVSVTALLGVVSQSVFNGIHIKNKAVGISLAQEGVELVRNIQDSALLANEYQTFEIFAGTLFQPCVFNEGICTIDPLSLVINSCPNQTCPPLRISDTGYFNYTFGEESQFTRAIEIIPTSENSGRVTVTVSWEQGSTTREVVYEEELFLWIE